MLSIYIDNYTLLSGDANYKVAEEAFPSPNKGPSSNTKQWKSGNNSETLHEFYKDIPETIVDEIRELYLIDFIMFGYDTHLGKTS